MHINTVGYGTSSIAGYGGSYGGSGGRYSCQTNGGIVNISYYSNVLNQVCVWI